MKGIGSSLATGLVIIIIVFLFVRPGSKGTTLVTAVSNGLKNVITASTGGGSWSKA